MSNKLAVTDLLTDEEYATLTPAQKLAYWEALKPAMKAITDEEARVRRDIVAGLFPNAQSGTNTFPLADGREVKAVIGTNYTLAGNEAVDAVCDQIERIGNQGAFLAERLITWTPKLAVGEYKELDTNSEDQKLIKSLLDTIITTKPAMPTLEIVTPSKKK